MSNGFGDVIAEQRAALLRQLRGQGEEWQALDELQAIVADRRMALEGQHHDSLQSILEACLETVESSLEVRLMAQEQGLKALELAELYRSQLERLQAGGTANGPEVRPHDEPESNAKGVIVESDRARGVTSLPGTGHLADIDAPEALAEAVLAHCG